MSENANVCPVCGGSATPLPGEGYLIPLCDACAHGWTVVGDDLPGETDYPPRRSELPDGRPDTGLLSVFMRHRIAMVKAACDGGRLLDVGCGDGAFAWAAHDAGYEVTGVEPFALPNPRPASPRLLAGTLDDIADERFDLVTAWHVLEHIPQPVALLEELHRVVAPGGRVLLCVPNIESWQARLFGRRWFHLDPPRHLHHFSRRSLEATLRAGGWRPVSWRWWVPEYSISGWVQSAINTYEPARNVLYEAVKDRGALEGMSTARRRVLVGGSLVAAALLAPVAAVLSVVAAVARRSATLTVVVEPQRDSA